MKVAEFTLLILCVALSGVMANEAWTAHPEWSGAWEETPEVARLLGFQAEEGHSRVADALHLGFFVSKDAAIAVLGREAVERVQERTTRMNHEIVAAGRFGDTTDGDGEVMCFVTEKEGATYLWLGSQAESVRLAKVHYIRGVDPEHDLLVLDFGGVFEKRLRGGNQPELLTAAGYRRASR